MPTKLKKTYLITALISSLLVGILILFVFTPDFIDPLKHTGITLTGKIERVIPSNRRTPVSKHALITVRLSSGQMFAAEANGLKKNKTVEIAVYKRLITQREVYKLIPPK